MIYHPVLGCHSYWLQPWANLILIKIAFKGRGMWMAEKYMCCKQWMNGPWFSLSAICVLILETLIRKQPRLEQQTGGLASEHGCVSLLQVVMLKIAFSSGLDVMGASVRRKLLFLILMPSWRKTRGTCKLWVAEDSFTLLSSSRRYYHYIHLQMIFLRVSSNISVRYHRLCDGLTEIQSFSQNLVSKSSRFGWMYKWSTWRDWFAFPSLERGRPNLNHRSYSLSLLCTDRTN